MPIAIDVEIDIAPHDNVHIVRDDTIEVGALLPKDGIFRHLENIDDVGLLQPQKLESGLIVILTIVLAELHVVDFSYSQPAHGSTDLFAEALGVGDKLLAFFYADAVFLKFSFF